MKSSTIVDSEFGEIVVRPNRRSTRISLRVAPDGKLRASVPPRTSSRLVQVMIDESREKIRELISECGADTIYGQSQQIGKSHSLVIQTGFSTVSIKTSGTKIIVQTPSSAEIKQPDAQQDIKKAIIKALRKEAKSYLPRRLKYLADEHGFSYESTKITHASSRWGSCSSRGTISMNISLMRLPFELIDYVLIHELCHTREMNHSQRFWSEVEAIDPNFKLHRKLLKNYSPHI